MKEQSITFNSRRSPVIGSKGMVAASQPLAVSAGLQILREGGTAADAAIATAAALNVTEPCSTGLGGDAFVLYYHAQSKQVYALNGSGRAPAHLTLERLEKEGFDKLPPFHPYAVTVPGACAAWCDLVERFGCFEMQQVLAPALELAEGGFPLAPLTSLSWSRAAEHGQLSQALNGQEIMIDGRGPKAGEVFRNPGLARAFREIANGGKKAFYEGQIAESIAAIVQEAGGCLTVDDLAVHQSTWEEAISIEYHGVRVWECPPNGQGLAALLALNILKGFDIKDMPALSIERLHLEIEALRLAFADARHYITDTQFNPAPLSDLLGDAYTEERRKLIDPGKANLDVKHGLPPASSDTVYFSVVDAEGNACSMVNSNYMGFGTGIVPRGWGFTLQNRGHNFSLDAQHPNALAPGKRPYHTIIPAMATYEADSALYASFGVMGGFMQPQGHLQVALALIDDALDPQAALDRPRYCLRPEQAGGKLAIEEGFDFETLSALASMGHPLVPVSGLGRAIFGRGQIIKRDPVSGMLWAGSDPRADGLAMTL